MSTVTLAVHLFNFTWIVLDKLASMLFMKLVLDS